MDTNQDQEYLREEHNTRKNQYSDTDTLERNWKYMRIYYRQQYPNITDEDVNYKDGEFNTMTERIAQRTNRRRQDVQNDIRNWNNEEEK